MTSLELDVPRFRQPDEVSCGPTCLRKVTSYFADPVDEAAILASVPRNADGGTFAACLGIAARRLGYEATLYPFALQVFDPTWAGLPAADLLVRLRERTAGLPAGRLRDVHTHYAEFLAIGGRVALRELTPRLLVTLLDQRIPLVCGVSATWLYQVAREDPVTTDDDDVHGAPVGHFVVVSGYEKRGRRFVVLDPWEESPLQRDLRYVVPARRLLHAVLLGDVTYDAVFLAMHPPHPPDPNP